MTDMIPPPHPASPVTPAEAIEAADLVEAETAYRLQFAREMYEAGRRDAEAEMAARWARIAAPVVRGQSFAELDERRYGPGGRARYAHLGDHPGRAAEHEAEAEPEISA